VSPVLLQAEQMGLGGGSALGSRKISIIGSSSFILVVIFDGGGIF